MGPFATHEGSDDNARWLAWLTLLIAFATLGIATWYAMPWVIGPFSWLVETVIPVWIDQHCIVACEALTGLAPSEPLPG